MGAEAKPREFTDDTALRREVEDRLEIIRNDLGTLVARLGTDIGWLDELVRRVNDYPWEEGQVPRIELESIEVLADLLEHVREQLRGVLEPEAAGQAFHGI